MSVSQDARIDLLPPIAKWGQAPQLSNEIALVCLLLAYVAIAIVFIAYRKRLDARCATPALSLAKLIDDNSSASFVSNVSQLEQSSVTH